MKLYKYCLVFFFFSILGFLFEKTLFNKQYNTFIERNLPLLPTYGLGGVILFYIASYDMSIITKTLFAAISLTILECIVGLISYQIHNKFTWKYITGYPFCFGYNSIYVSLIWALLSFSFFIIYDKLTE